MLSDDEVERIASSIVEKAAEDVGVRDIMIVLHPSIQPGHQGRQ